MGVKFVGADFNAAASRITVKVEGGMRAMKTAVEEVIEQGEDQTRYNTVTTPSAKSGKSGRVESHDMEKALGHKITTANKNHVVGEYGFINGVEDYFIYQTVTGFTHWRSGAFIEPTFALRDAEEVTRQIITSRIAEGFR